MDTLLATSLQLFALSLKEKKAEEGLCWLKYRGILGLLISL